MTWSEACFGSTNGHVGYRSALLKLVFCTVFVEYINSGFQDPYASFSAARLLVALEMMPNVVQVSNALSTERATKAHLVQGRLLGSHKTRELQRPF